MTSRRRHRLDDPGHLLLLADRTMALRRLLRESGAWPLGARRVLDAGCGGGDSLATLLAAGGPAEVAGIDADAARLPRCRDRVRPGFFAAADACALPFEGGAFDVVLLFTVLSSIVAGDDRRRVASECLRVLRSGGAVLLYDFAANPANRETRGLPLREARILFPDCAFTTEAVTPLPAMVRRLARSGRPRTWLSRLPVPRTHHLSWITKKSTP